jgi:hypothetical protein
LLQPSVGGVVGAASKVFAEAVSDETDTNGYLEAKEAIASFLTALEDLPQDSGKPMVIMIDELDRCRPSYAIELLEVAKHLFAVNNVVFVLAVNRAQMVHSVKALYGAGFDAEGYLRRFFDLDFQLPEPGREQFVQELLETTELASILDTRESQDERQTARALLEAFLGSPELGLRDVQQAVHRLGLVMALLPANTALLAFTAVIAIIVRTVDFEVYRRFVAGEATDEEVVDAVFELEGTKPLRSETLGWGIQNRIILGLLETIAKGDYYQDFSFLQSSLLPLLDKWWEWRDSGARDDADVRKAMMYLERIQRYWEEMRWPDPG